MSGVSHDTTSGDQFCAALYGASGAELARSLVGTGLDETPAAGALVLGPDRRFYVTGARDNGHDQDGFTVGWSLTK